MIVIEFKVNVKEIVLLIKIHSLLIWLKIIIINIAFIFFFFFFFFFIIQRMKARAIPCPHQLPTRGDNTVSVAQGGTVTPGATKQLLPPVRVLREFYIYIYARSIKSRDYINMITIRIIKIARINWNKNSKNSTVNSLYENKF